jgi:hypothetical protein
LFVAKGCYAIKHGDEGRDATEFSIVIAYNGMDHYVPTKSVLERKFNDALMEVKRHLVEAEKNLHMASFTSDARFQDNVHDMKANFKVSNYSNM